MPRKKSECNNPSVENCLQCTKKECTCKIGTPLDKSEMLALLAAEMCDQRAINAFNRTKDESSRINEGERK